MLQKLLFFSQNYKNQFLDSFFAVDAKNVKFKTSEIFPNVFFFSFIQFKFSKFCMDQYLWNNSIIIIFIIIIWYSLRFFKLHRAFVINDLQTFLEPYYLRTKVSFKIVAMSEFSWQYLNLQSNLIVHGRCDYREISRSSLSRNRDLKTAYFGEGKLGRNSRS